LLLHLIILLVTCHCIFNRLSDALDTRRDVSKRRVATELKRVR